MLLRLIKIVTFLEVAVDFIKRYCASLDLYRIIKNESWAKKLFVFIF